MNIYSKEETMRATDRNKNPNKQEQHDLEF